MSTIKEVAQRAGVSVTTVSRTLNNRGYISDDMRERIRRAMEELDYHPNEVARSLTKRSTRIIGVLLPLMNPFFQEVVTELSRVLTAQGYKMMLYTAAWTDDHADEYIKMLKANQVDGLIVCFRGKAIEDALSDNLPAVSFERLKVGRLPTILCDNEAGGRLAAQALIGRGCKHPAFIGSFFSSSIPAYGRKAGFVSVIREHGLPEHLVESSDRSLEGYRTYPDLAKTLLDRYPETDGIFCSSDLLAAAVLREAQRRGKKIPQELQIIGFNSNQFCEELYPSLSSIRQPLPDMCGEAVQCILRQIRGENVPLETIFPVTLDCRESTKQI